MGRSSHKTIRRFQGGLRRELRRRVTFGLYALVLLWVTTPSPGQSIEEHELKALFLFNFASFVTWPPQAFESRASPIRYCVTGDGALTRALRQLLRGERIKGRPLALRTLSDGQAAGACHVLYLPSQSPDPFPDLLADVAEKPALTVSDRREFVATGGMVALIRDRSRVRPIINLEAARNAGLRISSKLLRLSIVTNTSEPR